MQKNPLVSKTFKIQLKTKKALGDDYFELIFSRPENFDYIAGQRIRFIEENLERDYSLISIPSDTEIKIYFRLIPGGRFSPKLIQANIGNSFTITGPHGHFRYYSSPRKAIFIATGTGLAPFVAFARSKVEGVTLLHGIRDTKDLHYDDLFVTRGFNYITCLTNLTKENVPTKDGVKIYSGNVGNYLSECLPKENYDFYVCGSSAMIRDVTHIIDRLFPDAYLFYEAFY
ncbi:MAG: FAD-binding oxidoreductase [Desulfobacteraceae bacterium]|jgi:ferredoxin-NADP reductase